MLTSLTEKSTKVTIMNCEKYIKDGKVAVLYSPNFGAGWYSWNTDTPELLFDKDIVAAVLDNNLDKAEEVAIDKYPTCYLGGVRDLTVKWLEPGTQFEINEYDGFESITEISSKRYLEA